jgi:hypothetical protein
LAGIRGMGKGNLNASRHPWKSFWRRRALKPQHRWVLPVIEGYANDLIAEKGDVTHAERRVIEIAQISRGCSMLILAECANQGLMRKLPDGSWDLHVGAKELSRYLSTELKALGLVGLDRRCAPVQTLESYVKERYSKRESEPVPKSTSEAP